MPTTTAAGVAVDQAAYYFDKPYDYLIPEHLAGSVKPGCRVTVPFGKGDRKRVGLVLYISEHPGDKPLKYLSELIDKEPVLDRSMLALCEYMHDTVFCTYFDGLRAIVPPGLTHRMSVLYTVADKADLSGCSDEERRVFAVLAGSKKPATERKIAQAMGLESVEAELSRLCSIGAVIKQDAAVRRMGDATVKMVRPTDSGGERPEVKLSPKQYEVMRLLYEAGGASVKEICYFTGVTPAVITAVVKKGLAEYYDEETYHDPREYGNGEQVPIELTDEQSAQFERLSAALNSGNYTPSLLFGVTGSGKTQIFLKLADECIASGRGVIILVPEIALTPQMLGIFSGRYGGKVAVFHSAMSMGRRLDEWKRVKNGEASIVVGTRSAIFAPMDNIGLIVIDEEQESTYKSEQSPRYHARDVAKFRAAQQGALLLLASATPSVESFSLAKSGKYMLCCLKKRYGNAILPDVVTVDMREELTAGRTGSISLVLQEKLRETLDGGRQAIILLNRRGHNTYVGCPACGYAATCDNCSISMTYHSANGRLVCHYCGASHPVPSVCPVCGNSHLRFMGAGTQRVEEELNSLFPGVGVLRMDSDSTMTRNAYESKFSEFAEGKYGIMLGTQMVAKGLDFDRVTLVGVLGADNAALSEDYRGFERAFSLLTQVVGRSGRGSFPGTAVIQTFDPTLKLIELAKAQDYEAFYNDEIMTRRLMVYPPYCGIVMVGILSADRRKAESAAKQLFDGITALINGEYKDVRLIILGPSPASIPRVNGRYRYRLLIKCRPNARFREMLKCAVEKQQKEQSRKDVTIFVDVNPETIL